MLVEPLDLHLRRIDFVLNFGHRPFLSVVIRVFRIAAFIRAMRNRPRASELTIHFFDLSGKALR